MKRTLGILTVACALWSVAQDGSQRRATVFPLAPGTYWVYEGEVTYNLTPNEITTQTMRRRMQVEQVVTGANFRAAYIKGGPWDFELFSPTKAPGDYLIVETADGSYFTEGPKARELFKKIKAGGLTHDVRDRIGDNLWFREPLRSDGIYCPPDQLAREDGMYCWKVIGTKPQRGAEGSKSGARPTYQLTYKTSPDEETVDIVPGIGVTHFVYGRSGRGTEVDVKMIEFHPGRMTAQ